MTDPTQEQVRQLYHERNLLAVLLASESNGRLGIDETLPAEEQGQYLPLVWATPYGQVSFHVTPRSLGIDVDQGEDVPLTGPHPDTNDGWDGHSKDDVIRRLEEAAAEAAVAMGWLR